MERICDCELERAICPDQKDLRGGSQWPGMTCEQILKGMTAMAKRIIENSDAAGIEGVSREKFFDRLLKEVTENMNNELLIIDKE